LYYNVHVQRIDKLLQLYAFDPPGVGFSQAGCCTGANCWFRLNSIICSLGVSHLRIRTAAARWINHIWRIKLVSFFCHLCLWRQCSLQLSVVTITYLVPVSIAINVCACRHIYANLVLFLSCFQFIVLNNVYAIATTYKHAFSIGENLPYMAVVDTVQVAFNFFKDIHCEAIHHMMWCLTIEYNL